MDLSEASPAEMGDYISLSIYPVQEDCKSRHRDPQT